MFTYTELQRQVRFKKHIYKDVQENFAQFQIKQRAEFIDTYTNT